MAKRTIADQMAYDIASTPSDDTLGDGEDFDDLAFEDRILAICKDQIALEAKQAKHKPMTFAKDSTVNKNYKPGQAMFDTLLFLHESGKDVRSELTEFEKDGTHDPMLRERANDILRDTARRETSENNVGISIFTALSDIYHRSLCSGNTDLQAKTVADLRNFSMADHLSPVLRAKASKLAEQHEAGTGGLIDDDDYDL